MSAPAIPYIILSMSTPEDAYTRKHRWLNLALILLSLALFTTWLALTPPGVDGKVNAVGYSVCHQIDSHSYTIGGNVLPLCARCTGTFLGLLISILFLYSKHRKSGFPSRLKMVVLLFFFLFFAFDGINASLPLLGIKGLYPSSNLLRLISGLLFGITLANVVVPLWHQTLWVQQNPQPVFHSWRQLGWLLLFCTIIGVLVVADIAFLYYPLAILSTATIFLVLGMIYALLWCIILKKENSLRLLQEGLRIFSAGLITAITQVGVMDLIRYSLSGTW